jgi:YD repeat-containing protein
VGDQSGGDGCRKDYDHARQCAETRKSPAGLRRSAERSHERSHQQLHLHPASQVRSLDQSNTSYNYTDTLNRTGVYEPNGLNQYQKVYGQVFAYDASGNLIQDRASDGTLTTYTYDMQNHLVQVARLVGGTLSYDVLGRLSRLTLANGTTDSLYDGDALVAEYLNGTLSRRYVHGDQVDEPLIEYQGTKHPPPGQHHRAQHDQRRCQWGKNGG